MKKILITGFSPFLDHDVNPTQIIVQKLAEKNKPYLKTQVLPTVFKYAFDVLQKAMSADVACVLMLGLASSRDDISLEKIALNWVETQRPDNQGQVYEPQMIDVQFPLALMTKIDLNTLKSELSSQGIDAELSFSAGTYVCNYTYFKMLSQFPSTPCLFVHIPEFSSAFDETQLLNLTEKIILYLKKNYIN